MGKLLHIEYNKVNLTTLTPAVEAIVNFDFIQSTVQEGSVHHLFYNNRGFRKITPIDEFIVTSFLSPNSNSLITALDTISVTVTKVNLYTLPVSLPTKIEIGDIIFIYPYGSGSQIITIKKNDTADTFDHIVVTETLDDIIALQTAVSVSGVPSPQPCSLLVTDSTGSMMWKYLSEFANWDSFLSSLGCEVGFSLGGDYGYGTGSGDWGFGFCETGGDLGTAPNVDLTSIINVDDVLDENVYLVRGLINVVDYGINIVFEGTIGRYDADPSDSNISRFAILEGSLDGKTVACGSLKIFTGNNNRLSKHGEYSILAGSHINAFN